MLLQLLGTVFVGCGFVLVIGGGCFEFVWCVGGCWAGFGGFVGVEF